MSRKKSSTVVFRFNRLHETVKERLVAAPRELKCPVYPPGCPRCQAWLKNLHQLRVDLEDAMLRYEAKKENRSELASELRSLKSIIDNLEAPSHD